MPIYGYRCTQCGREMEVMQSISDKPLHTCPVCMGPLQKMLYPVGVIYKGSGYYSTDYKNSGSSRSGGSGESASDDKGKSDSPPKESSSKESGAKEKSGSGE